MSTTVCVSAECSASSVCPSALNRALLTVMSGKLGPETSLLASIHRIASRRKALTAFYFFLLPEAARPTEGKGLSDMRSPCLDGHFPLTWVDGDWCVMRPLSCTSAHVDRSIALLTRSLRIRRLPNANTLRRPSFRHPSASPACLSTAAFASGLYIVTAAHVFDAFRFGSFDNALGDAPKLAAIPIAKGMPNVPNRQVPRKGYPLS
jgi:hypothetical protein